MKIPFVDLQAQYQSIRPQIDGAIATVIANTSFIGGPPVVAFESAFAEAYGVKHVVGCANGTDSLYIIMKMLGIGPGDEVITAANSWISSSETITQAGARAVFVDVHEDYYSLDETLLEACITPRTRALIAVHLQGQVCNMEAIQQICEKKGIFLIEDCAQSHFSKWNGKNAGLFGIAGSFSFYPGKNLGAYGDAGCIITNDEQLAQKCRMYSHHGALKKHAHQMEGINSRLDSLQAAILSAKLPFLDKWTEQRILHAALYSRLLENIPGISRPVQRPGTRHTWHLYVIRTKDRTGLARFLADNGIETAVHYPLALPNLSIYEYLGYPAGHFPVATRLQDEILSLPIYPEMTEEQIRFVCERVREYATRN